MSNAPSHLPGDLGENDPRREAHPHGNIPHSGGHEVRFNSSEVTGNNGATAAEHSHNSDPRNDNSAAQAFEGGSTETMDRHKRQQASGITGGRTGHDAYDDTTTRGGLQQESTRGAYDNNSSLRGPGQESNYTRDQEYGSGIGSGIGSGLTGGSHHQTGHHTGSSGLTSGYGNQSGTEPISGVRGAGVGGAPYDAGNVQSSGFGGSEPHERHQLHHGEPPHQHDFSHQHNTRTGELLDPASGRDTGLAHLGTHSSGLTGSNTGAYGHESTGERLREGVTGSHGTHGTHGSGLTGSNTGAHGHESTGERLREGEERLTGRDNYGSTGTSGLTGSHGSGLTGSNTGAYGHESTGERLREGEERLTGRDNYGSTGTSGLTGSHGSGLTGSNTHGSGLTGSNTAAYGHESTGERLREGEERLTGRDNYGSTTGTHNTTGTTGTHDTTGTHSSTHDATHDTTKQPSLLDKLNPLKDSDGDGKKGFMK